MIIIGRSPGLDQVHRLAWQKWGTRCRKQMKQGFQNKATYCCLQQHHVRQRWNSAAARVEVGVRRRVVDWWYRNEIQRTEGGMNEVTFDTCHWRREGTLDTLDDSGAVAKQKDQALVTHCLIEFDSKILWAFANRSIIIDESPSWTCWSTVIISGRISSKDSRCLHSPMPSVLPEIEMRFIVHIQYLLSVLLCESLAVTVGEVKLYTIIQS